MPVEPDAGGAQGVARHAEGGGRPTAVLGQARLELSLVIVRERSPPGV